MIQDELVSLRLPYPDGEDRLVQVFVPAHEEGETLPVIYMSDGQNLFDKETARFGCWNVREAVAAEREASGRAAVIVGIDNGQSPSIRNSDLTPASIGKIQGFFFRHLAYPHPKGEIFDRFVTETVMPAVERQFPVRRGREATAFCGSSSGGLESFFIAMSHPDLFGAAGVFSPVFLLYTEKDLRRWMQEKLRPAMPFLYVYCGAGNKQEKQLCDSVEKTYPLLEELLPAECLKKVIIPEAPHNEAAWEPVFKDFLHIFLTRP